MERKELENKIYDLIDCDAVNSYAPRVEAVRCIMELLEDNLKAKEARITELETSIKEYWIKKINNLTEQLAVSEAGNKLKDKALELKDCYCDICVISEGCNVLDMEGDRLFNCNARFKAQAEKELKGVQG